MDITLFTIGLIAIGAGVLIFFGNKYIVVNLIKWINRNKKTKLENAEARRACNETYEAQLNFLNRRILDLQESLTDITDQFMEVRKSYVELSNKYYDEQEKSARYHSKTCVFYDECKNKHKKNIKE